MHNERKTAIQSKNQLNQECPCTHVLKKQLTLPLQNKNVNEEKKKHGWPHFRLDCLRPHWPVGQCLLEDAGSRKGKLFQLLHQDMPDIWWWSLNWLGHSLQRGHCLIWKHCTTTHQALKKLSQKKKAWVKLCRYDEMILNANTYLE